MRCAQSRAFKPLLCATGPAGTLSYNRLLVIELRISPSNQTVG